MTKTSFSMTNDRLAAVPEHECEGSGLRDEDLTSTHSFPGQVKQSCTPFFRGKRRSSSDGTLGTTSSASAHSDTPMTAPVKPKPGIPDCITANRELDLTMPQLLSNRRHLEAPLVQLVQDAVRPFVLERDCELVSKAVAEMMVHVDQAETSDTLVDVLARRLPVLERIAAHWQSMAKVWYKSMTSSHLLVMA